MKSTVEEIKDRLSVVDVVGSYLKLEKAGINLKSRCPFHNEKTPSFFVSPSRNSYYCFGCGKGGDIFNFVQDFEGVDFVGSLKILADKAGVEIKKVDPKLQSEFEKLFKILEESTLFLKGKLQENKEALKYLKERGLEEKTIEEFCLGFAPDEWRSLLEHLKSKGFSEKEMEKAGVIKESDGKYYDRFRNRIMFPVSDASGRPVAFSGRILGKESEGVPKYLNSPEIPIFKKSTTLFAYDKAKLEIRRKDFAILVEGNIDVLMAHQAGYRNVVAPLGTALTKEQVERISKLTKKVVIAFDSDSAGFKASSRGAKIALSSGIDLKVAIIPEGLDPAELILKDLGGWKKAIKDSRHIVEFYLSKLRGDETDKRKLGLRVKEEVLPFVAMIENKIDQAHFIKLLSEAMGVSEVSVYEEVAKISIEGLSTSYPEEKASEIVGRRKNIIRKLFGIISLMENSEKESIKTELSRITGGEDILDSISEKEREGIIFSAGAFTDEGRDLRGEAGELLKLLEEDFLREELNNKRMELKKAEEKGDRNLSQKILETCQNLSKKIEEIKSKSL